VVQDSENSIYGFRLTIVSGIRDGTRVLVRVLSAVVVAAAVAVGKIAPSFWLAVRTTLCCGQNLDDPLMFLQDRDFCLVTRVTRAILARLLGNDYQAA